MFDVFFEFCVNREARGRFSGSCLVIIGNQYLEGT